MADKSSPRLGIRSLLTLTFLLMVGAVVASVLITAQMNQGLPEPWRRESFIMSIAVPAIISPPIWAIIAVILVRNHRLMGEVEKLANFDPLTNLMNRRAYLRAGHRKLKTLRAEPTAVTAMVMIDIDWFKSINDCHGHATGDAAIVHVSKLISEFCEPGDLCARLGGDEFAILLSTSSARAAYERAANLGSLIGSSPMVSDRGEKICISASVGVAVAETKDPELSEDELGQLIARADSALYKSKNQGRNRTSLAA